METDLPHKKLATFFVGMESDKSSKDNPQNWILPNLYTHPKINSKNMETLETPLKKAYPEHKANFRQVKLDFPPRPDVLADDDSIYF